MQNCVSSAAFNLCLLYEMSWPKDARFRSWSQRSSILPYISALRDEMLDQFEHLPIKFHLTFFQTRAVSCDSKCSAGDAAERVQ